MFGIKVLYEDEMIVVVDKPSGMVVDEVAVQTRAILVHRLDKDTSGVMVLAKTAVAAEGLRRQFEERKVVKKYVALVHGIMKEDQGLITTPVQRYPKDQLRSAITEWQVIQKHSILNAQYSMLELMPHTGRTHQIRKHLKSIVADPLYGFRKKIKTDLTWCPRMFLHAKNIEFTHPVTGAKVAWTSQLPPELQTVLDNLVH